MLRNTKLLICSSICLLAAIYTIYILGTPRKLYGDPTSEVTFDLPEKIDFYDGEYVWHCHVKQCARSYTQSELDNEQNDGNLFYCKDCDEKWNTLKQGTKEYDKFHAEVINRNCFILKDRSVGEKALLPDNTPIRRRNYKTQHGTQLTATVVFSGIERGSIHRPQNCLRAAGGKIYNEYTHTINIPKEKCKDLEEDKKLDIHIINLSNTYTTASGETEVVHSIYAYWFFNPFKETESHTQRFIYTIYDGAIFNYRPRWAYVSVAFNIDQNNPDGWKTTLEDFIPRLYPYLEEYRKQERDKRWIETTIETTNENK